ncbi:Nucleic-acid-binding protein from mobile element jockey [Amphibalanus amphitrite]|uniref:Nucleic-acid-binding protein from mobile element jockey n=1 Tax=Amphibalanus amphitrite TaxID=1232801 RepID=A0A6A4W8S3_AMPAM|nr:Nucleic-acid-binding protein from mobile element jockey [Amphibalanus amphitrite]
MTKRGTVSTNNIILTFDSTDLPSEIRVGYVKVRVRPFVPAPMRCFRCQRFGHTKDNCRGRPTCSKCASQDHTDETCDSETPRCVNCGEGQTPHSAYDRSCPAYVKEKEIMTIKATRNLSFKEAREVYNQSHPKTSYAQKMAASFRPSVRDADPCCGLEPFVRQRSAVVFLDDRCTDHDALYQSVGRCLRDEDDKANDVQGTAIHRDFVCDP